MIKKLQIKFIFLTMSSLLLVIAIIVASMNLVNYHSVIKEADSVLAFLSEHKNTMPSGMVPPKEDNKNHELPKELSPETPYESRYFSVLLDKESGSIIQAETSRIVSVDTKEAIAYAQSVMDEDDDKGFVDAFRYQKQIENDKVKITFLDCGRKLDSFWNFFLTSIGISLLGYAIVFLCVIFLSNRIVRPLSESYEKQKRFITDAGHEIKTPLTIINADVDVLEMEYGENEWLKDIQKQAKRLTKLTNDLVYLARMEESEKSRPMIEFPFSDIVSEAATSFQALAQTQNKQFYCKIQPMLSLYGNEQDIYQLVTILLDNALKYSPENGIVSLHLEKHNRSIQLTVFNTVENTIPKDNLNQLFERFYRIDSSHNSQTGGHGIGLSVAKAIVTAHNGKIQASSRDGNSLEITVTF